MLPAFRLNSCVDDKVTPNYGGANVGGGAAGFPHGSVLPGERSGSFKIDTEIFQFDLSVRNTDKFSFRVGKFNSCVLIFREVR